MEANQHNYIFLLLLNQKKIKMFQYATHSEVNENNFLRQVVEVKITFSTGKSPRPVPSPRPGMVFTNISIFLNCFPPPQIEAAS